VALNSIVIPYGPGADLAALAPRVLLEWAGGWTDDTPRRAGNVLVGQMISAAQSGRNVWSPVIAAANLGGMRGGRREYGRQTVTFATAVDVAAFPPQAQYALGAQYGQVGVAQARMTTRKEIAIFDMSRSPRVDYSAFASTMTGVAWLSPVWDAKYRIIEPPNLTLLDGDLIAPQEIFAVVAVEYQCPIYRHNVMFTFTRVEGMTIPSPKSAVISASVVWLGQTDSASLTYDFPDWLEDFLDGCRPYDDGPGPDELDLNPDGDRAPHTTHYYNGCTGEHITSVTR
jgi:hypothetical protein